jgi:hypothetical protein
LIQRGDEAVAYRQLCRRSRSRFGQETAIARGNVAPIASNATTLLNMISCYANGGATNSRKLELRRGQWPRRLSLASYRAGTPCPASGDAGTAKAMEPDVCIGRLGEIGYGNGLI